MLGRFRRWDAGARALVERLVAAGHEAYLVGGCVRDMLLGLIPHDWDITTSAEPDALQALFPHGKLMGATRGTQTLLVVQDGRPYEITPYRGATLAEDLSRRDFTVNALALGLDRHLQDPLGGRRDLRHRVLRGCGDPAQRLIEDPLRLLRAVRLAAQFDLAIDAELQAALKRVAPELGRVAPERVGMELGRLLVTQRPAWGMERLRELGLLPAVLPELMAAVGFAQNQYHRFPVWEHLLLACALTPPQLPLRLAGLLHDVGKPQTLSVDEAGNRHFYGHELVGAELADQALARLRFDNDTRHRAVHLVRYHMDLFMEGPVSDAAIRRMVRRIGPEHMNDLIQLRRADRLASGTREGDLGPETIALLQQVEQVLQADAALKVTDLAVDGHDVMRIYQCPPGEHVGRILQRLLDEVVEEPERNSRDGLLARLAQFAAQGSDWPKVPFCDSMKEP
ncbi:MAG: CCA tRNA nucleotidyltransferase [Mycobacterium leprae]